MVPVFIFIFSKGAGAGPSTLKEPSSKVSRAYSRMVWPTRRDKLSTTVKSSPRYEKVRHGERVANAAFHAGSFLVRQNLEHHAAPRARLPHVLD